LAVWKGIDLAEMPWTGGGTGAGRRAASAIMACASRDLLDL